MNELMMDLLCPGSQLNVAPVWTWKVLFSPDNTMLKFPVVLNRWIFSEYSLYIINNNSKNNLLRDTGQQLNLVQMEQIQRKWMEEVCTSHFF